MKKFNSVKCFCCDADLVNWEYASRSGKLVNVHPMSGLHFQTYGHYGSTIFDPMDGTSLDIAICDECVLRHKNKVHGTGLKNLGR
jgi:hypothetical protein